MVNLYEFLKGGNVSTVITHGGKFHADDVFSVALIKGLCPDVNVVRVNKVTQEMKHDDSMLIVDIGGEDYDHHQVFAEYRPAESGNGIKYAAFGLLWRDLGVKIMGSTDLAEMFDNEFVSILDNTDNTGVTNMISQQIAMFNPLWNAEDQDNDAAFLKAVEFAHGILVRMIKSYRATDAAVSEVLDAAEAAENKNILVLDKRLPYINVVQALNGDRDDDDKIKFVVYPSVREDSGWSAKTVKDISTFPQKWCGATPEQLYEMTGCELTFCHVAGFTIGGTIKEDVVNACKLANI